MNRLTEVKQFKKIAGLLQENHEENDQWYNTFSDALTRLQISDKARKLVDRALSHADVESTYGDMDPKEAAKDFVRDIVAMFKNQVKENNTDSKPFDFVKSSIEAASGDKISHTEEDDYGRTIYWSTKNPNVTYYIDNDNQIIKYDGETGERYPIGDLRHYDEPGHEYEPDTDADYEEPRDWGMSDDYNDGEFWESQIKGFRKIAGIKEDDYSEDPSSDIDDESQSGDTATMGNINEGEGITISIPENTGYKDFAKAVASELKSSYGTHNYRPFLQALVEQLTK
jgi:hypothetical protein